MWEQYKKTFWRMQVLIALVSVSVYTFFGHRWEMAAVFFVVMQWSAVIGATWAVRVKTMMTRSSEGLLKPRN